MLQRTKYKRGDCTNARSPAPIQRHHAANIFIRTDAPKILFPEATRDPLPVRGPRDRAYTEGYGSLVNAEHAPRVQTLTTASCRPSDHRYGGAAAPHTAYDLR